MAEPLSSGESEKSDVEYLFMARRCICILKLTERGLSQVRVGQRGMQFLFLCFRSITDVDCCPVTQQAGMSQAQ